MSIDSINSLWRNYTTADTIYIYCLGQLSGGFRLDHHMKLGINRNILSIDSGWVSIPALIPTGFSVLTTV